MKLFTAGPVACYPEVLEAMGMQMYSHRSAEYKKLHVETVEMLQRFLETQNEVFLFSSTGSGFMEASVLNCVNKKMLSCICGSFGERFAEAGTANGKQVETLEVPLGQPITPDLLDEKLSKTKDVEAVTITHNETSVGLMNHLAELAAVVKSHGKLVLVDSVSCMGGTPIDVDKWGLDVCFASSQKCFGVPPGLSVGAVSEAALEKSASVQNKGWYFDFKVWEKFNQKKKGTPMTSTIPQIAGMNAILKLIEAKGGKQWYFDLYAERNCRIREGVQKLGLTMFPKVGYESPTVNCVNAPEGVDGVAIYEGMRNEGFEVAKGYGSIQNTTFRIGNMGYIPFQVIDSMLEAMPKVLNNLGWNC
ncbi:MAG: alanine--glyoxylate aminotransferase family protein [Candidatus Bathyarchaeota archaeon]|nr:MAG: alanine--glyoxylate aminotransferase family protein [Candidatus Bathyarchaeota archaeon]